jgi:Divergent InlB B-repeat domain
MSGNGTFAPNLEHTVFEAGKRYTLTADAAKGYVFAGWLSNGVVVSTSSRYSLLLGSNVVLQANFIPNPFIPAVASYHGLFYVPNDASVESSGSFSASVTSAGAYSVRFGLGAANYVLAGEFSPVTGAASKSIPRRGMSPINVQLQLDFSNGPITGSISDGAWTADLVANPSIYSRTNPAPQAGKYTLLFPGSDNVSAQPGGNGYSSVTVNTLGNISLSGALGDGTPFISSSVVASEGRWPFYVSLYGGKGSILGWLSFTNGGNISGQIEWFKQPITTAKLYPGGFTNGTEAIGSVYHYTNYMPELGSLDGLLALSMINGDLAEGITNQAALGPYYPADDRSATKLECIASSGMFYGSVINPATDKPISVHGIVLQNQNIGAGYFLGTNQSGSVLLSPNQ